MPDGDRGSRKTYGLTLLLGVVLGIAFLALMGGMLAATWNEWHTITWTRLHSWSLRLVPWGPITLAGAFGGLLYGAKDRRLSIPHRLPNDAYTLDPGWLADMAFGIAGAFVVLLVIPTTDSFRVDFVGIQGLKFVAIALIGGYGGRALIDKVLSQTVKDLEERTRKVEDQVNQAELQKRRDVKALELVAQQLDPNLPAPPETDLAQVIKDASPIARLDILYRAKEFRRTERTRDRVLPILAALVNSGPDDVQNRYLAQYAYSLFEQKAKENAPKAIEAITKAIAVCEARNIKAHGMYEFFRAGCRIVIDPTPPGTRSPDSIRDPILADLKAGSEFDYVRNVYDRLYSPTPVTPLDERDRALKSWLDANGVTRSDLGLA